MSRTASWMICPAVKLLATFSRGTTHIPLPFVLTGSLMYHIVSGSSGTSSTRKYVLGTFRLNGAKALAHFALLSKVRVVPRAIKPTPTLHSRGSLGSTVYRRSTCPSPTPYTLPPNGSNAALNSLDIRLEWNVNESRDNSYASWNLPCLCMIYSCQPSAALDIFSFRFSNLRVSSFSMRLMMILSTFLSRFTFIDKE